MNLASAIPRRPKTDLKSPFRASIRHSSFQIRHSSSPLSLQTSSRPVSTLPPGLTRPGSLDSSFLAAKLLAFLCLSTLLTSCGSDPAVLFPQSKAPNAAVLKSDGELGNAFAQVLLINRLVCYVTEINGLPVRKHDSRMPRFRLSPGNYRVRIGGMFTIAYRTMMGEALFDLKVDANRTYRFGARQTQLGRQEARFFIEDVTDGERNLVAEQVVPFF